MRLRENAQLTADTHACEDVSSQIGTKRAGTNGVMLRGILREGIHTF